ncbi:MAG: DUF559 domain-containing protein [Desulfobacterales bacterium]|nr:DUF559 domain-containing protein [Desulfobacterales bacterium]
MDGSQHTEGDHASKDRRRDAYLVSLGLEVLRFNSRQVLQETDAVVEVIFRSMAQWLNSKNPP